MTKKLKIILIIFAVCLIGAGVFLARLEISDFFSGYFFNTWKGDETQTQTAQNLVLLNSHSHPEAGEKWVVSFETIGTADLIITPKDSDSIGDLDFASMKCAPSVALAEEGFGQEVIPEIQNGDVLFVPNWSCDGVGIVTHLVNIARKHALKFQFEDKMAFAYNNPDSITDSFDVNNPGGNPEYYIASKSNITVSGGQVRLSICGNNGTACTAAGECCSGYCYIDEDGDRYAPSSGTQKCKANSQLSGTDCYDANANAYPGQTTCYSTHRGDNSFDYNCVSGNEVCVTCLASDCVTYYGCGAGTVTCYGIISWGPCEASGSATVTCK